MGRRLTPATARAQIYKLLGSPDWQSTQGVKAVSARGSVASATSDLLLSWESEGLAAVAAGKVAIVLLAGAPRLAAFRPNARTRSTCYCVRTA